MLYFVKRQKTKVMDNTKSKIAINTNNKEIHPLISILLFFIAIILLTITSSIGFLYGIIHTLLNKKLADLGVYFLEMAKSIDQLGNVIMQHLLNAIWIKKEGYKFGNRDETISSVLGKNLKTNTLTYSGKIINKVLDFIDRNHSLNSIDYHIQPNKLTGSQ